MPVQLTPRQCKVNYGEFYGIGPNGNLWVEDCDTKELADRFGTPLFIIAESQFRYTYRAFRDAFRALNGFDAKEPSWEWPRWGGGYRLDHLIASAEVAVTACSYRHEWRREDRLSDHSALVAELSVGPPAPR